jgi:hypothetical protein
VRVRRSEKHLLWRDYYLELRGKDSEVFFLVHTLQDLFCLQIHS